MINMPADLPVPKNLKKLPAGLPDSMKKLDCNPEQMMLIALIQLANSDEMIR